MAFRAMLVAAALCAVVASAAAAAPRKATPALRLLRLTPATVQGTGFRPRERVRVVLRTSLGSALPELVRAGTRGTFLASFPNLPLGRCAGMTVSAAGARGSTAVLKRPPLPGCMPLSAPA